MSKSIYKTSKRTSFQKGHNSTFTRIIVNAGSLLRIRDRDKHLLILILI